MSGMYACEGRDIIMMLNELLNLKKIGTESTDREEGTALYINYITCSTERRIWYRN